MDGRRDLCVVVLMWLVPDRRIEIEIEPVSVA
jgi:hypothetical protein